MVRLTLTLFGLGHEREAVMKELFEACGSDYIRDIFLPFVNFDKTFHVMS